MYLFLPSWFLMDRVGRIVLLLFMTSGRALPVRGEHDPMNAVAPNPKDISASVLVFMRLIPSFPPFSFLARAFA